MPESRVVVQSIFIHAFDKIQNTKLLQVYDARFRANVLECLLALGTAAGHVLLEGLRLGDVGLLGLGVVGVEGGGGGVTGVSLGGVPGGGNVAGVLGGRARHAEGGGRGL